MTPPLVVKRRPIGPVRPGHVAEARRRLGARAGLIDDESLYRLLWVTRALPVALDVLADNRAEPSLGAARLTSARVLTREAGNGLLHAVGALFLETGELQVRFLRAPEAETVALVVWQVSGEVAEREGTPVIHRFVHGPRR